MKLERSGFLGAGPHERTPEHRGYANGYKGKRVKSNVGELELKIPQVRDTEEGFYHRSLEKGLRSERALKPAIAEMHIQWVSTRKVTEITKELCGLEVTSADVSRASKLLDDELTSWRHRPKGEIPYLILDACYEKVREGDSVIDCAVLVAIGVRVDGKRSVLGVSVRLSEEEVHWREFIASSRQRVMHGVRIVMSDDHWELKEALKTRLTGVKWQRCQIHLQRNTISFVPRVSMRRKVADGLKDVFNTPNFIEAE